MRIKRYTRLLALFTALALAACGGGGGGGGSDTPSEPEPPTPPPVENFQLTGTITASDSQAVDSDTNDPTRVVLANDTAATAQAIGNPVTLGGYINQAGTGATGRSRGPGDLDDFFVVDLLAGQRITMLVADFEDADADLYLYDENGSLLDFSLDTDDVEIITVEADGRYIVRAAIFFGATNYILAIGAPNVTETVAARAEFVPYEAVVTYEDTLAANSAGTARAALEQRMGLTQRAGGPGRDRRMSMRRDDAPVLASARLGRMAAIRDEITDPDLRARWETLQTIKALRRDPAVRYAAPNYIVRAQATPNDEAYPVQWHYPLIGLPDAWDTTTGDPNVIVAVIDTGILSGHPDLAGQLVQGYDFISDPANAGDGNGLDANPEDPGDQANPGSEAYHGTHVLGTVVARGNNQIGVVGSAFTSRGMPLRALGIDGGGTSYDVEQAVRYAAGLPNDSGTVPAQTADVINMSLGGPGFSEASQQLYNQVRQAGILVVAAAGNEATTDLGYPASYNGVISVSAVDGQRRLTSYSNTGSRVDVAAPGGDTRQDFNGDGYPDGVLSTDGSRNGNRVNFVYRFLNGTSMATPHVAGVLALMKSVNPALTPDEVDVLLEQGRLTDDLGPSGRDDFYGHGLINAQLAVIAAAEAAGSSPLDDPRLVASSNSLNFGVAGESLQVGLRNRGKGELAVTNITTSEPWLSVTPLDVDGAGLGEYEVNVDRATLPNGIYSAQINAQSSVNEVVIVALVSVGGSGAGSDVGVLYVLLYDPVADEPVAEFQSSGNNAVYPFQFFDIPPGQYEIIAGSDADNDLFICDAGESCGSYLTIDRPVLITLDRDMANLDFAAEFQVTAPTFSSLGAGKAQPDPGVRRPVAGQEDGVRRQP